jgi:hypothetical protein
MPGIRGVQVYPHWVESTLLVLSTVPPAPSSGEFEPPDLAVGAKRTVKLQKFPLGIPDQKSRLPGSGSSSSSLESALCLPHPATATPRTALRPWIGIAPTAPVTPNKGQECSVPIGRRFPQKHCFTSGTRSANRLLAFEADGVGDVSDLEGGRLPPLRGNRFFPTQGGIDGSAGSSNGSLPGGDANTCLLIERNPRSLRWEDAGYLRVSISCGAAPDRERPRSTVSGNPESNPKGCVPGSARTRRNLCGSLQ